MNINKLETTDIFRGAFFLCMGGQLADVRLKEDHRKMVSFMIEGDDLVQLDKDYMSGDALVNPLHFRETLNHLRDILFNKLRKERPASSRSRRDYAVATQPSPRLRRAREGRTRHEHTHHRKRKNRSHQNHR